jgi:septum formation inhibitor-activating ATPase MinD
MSGLDNIKRVIVVLSGKGGVGEFENAKKKINK